MICLDANVLIDIILDRQHFKACRQYIDLAKDDMSITMLSLDLIMYYAESNKLPLRPIEQFLRLFTWLPMTDADAAWAYAHYKAKDFEDALQVACALRERCKTFATLDAPLSKKYSGQIAIDLIR